MLARPVVGMAALAAGAASMVVPFLAQVALVPATFFLALIACTRGERRAGAWALALSVTGLVAMLFNASRAPATAPLVSRVAHARPTGAPAARARPTPGLPM